MSAKYLICNMRRHHPHGLTGFRLIFFGRFCKKGAGSFYLRTFGRIPAWRLVTSCWTPLYRDVPVRRKILSQWIDESTKGDSAMSFPDPVIEMGLLGQGGGIRETARALKPVPATEPTALRRVSLRRKSRSRGHYLCHHGCQG